MLTDTVRLILTADDLTKPAFTGMIANAKLMADETARLNDSLTAQRSILGDLRAGYTGLGGSLDASVAGLKAMRDASVAVTLAIREQIVAMGDLALVARTGTAPTAVGVGRTAAQDVGVLAGLRGTGGVARLTGAGGTGLTGLAETGGAFGLGGLGGIAALTVGIAALGATITAAKDAAAFTSAEAQVAANTGVPLSQVRGAGESALNLAASGKSPINATADVQGLLYAYSAQIAPSVIKQALPLFAQVAGIQGQPTTDLAVNAITDLQAAFGGGGKSATLQSLTYFADMLEKSEQVGKVPPGAIAGIVSKFAPSAILSHESLPDTLAAISKMTDSGASAQLASTYLTSLNTSLFLKPTATTQKIAANYGIELGANAVKDQGGGSLFQYLDLIKQRVPEALLGQFLSNARSIKGFGLLDLAQGGEGGLQFSAGLANANRASGGTTAQQFAVSQQGVMQQLADTSARFHADMTTVGTYLLKDVLPPLLTAAGLFLGFAESLPGAANKAGSVLDTVAKTLHMTKGDLVTLGTGPFAPISWAVQHPTQIGNALGATGTALGDAITALSTIGAAGPRILPSTFVGPLLPGEQRAPGAPQGVNSSIFGWRTPGQTFGAGALLANGLGIGVGSLGQVDTVLGERGGLLSRAGIGQEGLPPWTAADEAAANARYADSLNVKARTAAALGGIGTGVQGQSAFDKIQYDILTQQMLAAGQQVQAAQIFADSVRIHHGSVTQQQAAAQQIYQSQLQFITLEQKTGKLSGLGVTDAQNQALDTLNQTLNGLAQTQLKSYQDNVTLAQLLKNPGMLTKAIGAEGAFLKKDASQLGLSPTALQIMLLQLQQTKLQGTILPGPQLIRPTAAGLGALPEAGFGASVARLTGGTQDATSRMIAALQAQIAYQQQVIANQATELSELRKQSSSLSNIDRNTRPGPHTTAPKPSTIGAAAIRLASIF